MPNPAETAAQTYIRASGERDPAARAKLIEACFAEDGRIVTRSAMLRGRAGVDAMIARFHADPQMRGFRMTSAIDAAGTTFRYGSIVERRDGTSMEFFDAGEIDADGRIATLLVFAGPLADVTGDILEVNEHVRPEALQALLESEIGPEAKDTIVTAAQRYIEQGIEQGRQQGIEQGRQQGIEQGRQQGESAVLLRLVRQRFGDVVDPQVERRIASASIAQLDTWTARILSAATLTELLAD